MFSPAISLFFTESLLILNTNYPKVIISHNSYSNPKL